MTASYNGCYAHNQMMVNTNVLQHIHVKEHSYRYKVEKSFFSANNFKDIYVGLCVNIQRLDHFHTSFQYAKKIVYSFQNFNIFSLMVKIHTILKNNNISKRFMVSNL